MSGTTTTTTSTNLLPEVQQLMRDYFGDVRTFADQPFTPSPFAFNEAAYLAANPDVAAAVAGGAFPSGRAHYEQYGIAEGRSGAGAPGVAPLTADQQAAIERTRQIADQSAQVYGQIQGAVDSSMLPGAVSQAQEIAARQAALAGQAQEFLPYSSQALSQMPGRTAAAQQFSPITQNAALQAANIAGQTGQFMPLGQQAAQAGAQIAGLSGITLPGTTQAFQTGSQIAGAGSQVAGQTAANTLGLAQQFPGVNIGAYMNPYLEAVLAPALQDITERADIQRNALRANQARTGAFGGSRGALAEMELERNLQREIGRLTSEQMARGFDVGAQQFRQDQTILPQLYTSALNQLGQAQGLQQGAANIGTSLMGQLTSGMGLQSALSGLGTAGLAQLAQAQGLQRGAAEIAGLGIGQQGALQGMDAAQIEAANRAISGLAGVQGLNTGQLAALQGAAALENQRFGQLQALSGATSGRLASEVTPLLATGGLQQQQGQAGLDRIYQDWLAERDWMQRGLSAQQAALGLGGMGATGTTTTQAPKPNATAQTAGMIIGGLTALPTAVKGVETAWDLGSRAASAIAGWF